jgi:hypothetical protein
MGQVKGALHDPALALDATEKDGLIVGSQARRSLSRTASS